LFASYRTELGDFVCRLSPKSQLHQGGAQPRATGQRFTASSGVPGWAMLLPPLHHQLTIGPGIFVTEHMSMQLVWTPGRTLPNPPLRFPPKHRFGTSTPRAKWRAGMGLTAVGAPRSARAVVRRRSIWPFVSHAMRLSYPRRATSASTTSSNSDKNGQPIFVPDDGHLRCRRPSR
jgi:hypothetical protein